MALKTLECKNNIRLNRVFTDRIEPRKLFWDNYKYLKENINNGEAKVLSYYGIGGVGKTSICKKLINELDTKFLYYDLNISQDYKEILTHFKEELKFKYDFSFPLFEYGLYCNAIKRGHSAYKKEPQGIIKSSSFLSYVFKVAHTIPFVSNISYILENIDEGTTVIKHFFEKYNSQLKEIEVCDISSIETLLPTFFAMDLKNNLENETTPFVIILDTYEKLVNELSSIDNALDNDLWLRSTKSGCEGIILRVPKILWVIAGREKLKWHDFSNIWDNSALEQYCLSNLSKQDSFYYLNNANITDITLCKKIYEITNGVPIHLDLCVEQYETMINNNKTPTIHDFSNNIEELANNFLKYLDDELNDIIYILTCIEKWTDILFYKVSSFLNFNISPSKYEKIKHLSFVLTKDNVTYMFHQKIQEVLFIKCPETIKLGYVNFVAQSIDNYFSPKLNMCKKIKNETPTIGFVSKKINPNTINNSNTSTNSEGEKTKFMSLMNFEENIDNSTLSKPLNEELSFNDIGYKYARKIDIELSLNLSMYDMYYKYNEYLIECINTYNFYIFDKLFNKLISNVSDEDNKKTNTLYNTLYMLYFAKKGELRKAKHIMQEIETLYTKIQLNTEELLFVKKSLSTIYNYLGYYKIAHNINKELYFQCKKLYGKDHKETLLILHYLGTSYNNIGNKKRALTLRTLVYNKRKKLFGMHDTNTIRSLYRVGLSYISTKNYDKALEILNTVYMINCVHYGKEHPNTLKDIYNIGKIYYYKKDYTTALEKLTLSYNKRCIYIGKNHPDTLRTYYYIGLVYKEKKDYKKSNNILNEVYKHQIEYLGEKHPTTLNTKNVLDNIKNL